MTEDQYEKEMRRLKSVVTRARTKAGRVTTLAVKVESLRAVKAAELALHNHKLNRFVLVTP